MSFMHLSKGACWCSNSDGKLCSPFPDTPEPYSRWKGRPELLIALIKLTDFDYTLKAKPLGHKSNVCYKMPSLHNNPYPLHLSRTSFLQWFHVCCIVMLMIYYLDKNAKIYEKRYWMFLSTEMIHTSKHSKKKVTNFTNTNKL